MQALLDWVATHEGLLASLGILSVFTFIVSLIVFPIIIIGLPTDYFTRSGALPVNATSLRIALRILKNICGLCIVLLGILMLFLPGQGILALLLGFSLVDFPGKRRMQIQLLSNSRVRRSVDWVRLKGGKASLEIPNEAIAE
jgi:hypothetical protein